MRLSFRISMDKKFRSVYNRDGLNGKMALIKRPLLVHFFYIKTKASSTSTLVYDTICIINIVIEIMLECFRKKSADFLHRAVER